MHRNNTNMTVWNRLLRAFMACALAVNTGLVPGSSFAAQPATILDLPEPGTMLYVTPDFHPAIMRGVTIDADNPLQFDFLIDTGDQDLDGDDLQRESTRLIKYFLAALTVSEDKMWVNLSPFERDRIIPDEFGRTEMGRDLLAQDYLLKQLTASMIYPEDELGKKFWERVYQRAQTEFGTTDVPVNTYNKIWIIPETADVVVQGQTVYVVNSRLKVMLEEDYLALEHHSAEKPGDTNVLSEVSSQIVREILIPEIEREVNNGRTFANLRQIYHSMILATWYKKNLRESFLSRVYVDKNRVDGVDVADREINRKIYEQYVTAFKEGVYSYIKEEYDPQLDEIIPKKYFSGGVDHSKLPRQVREIEPGNVAAQIVPQGRILSVNTGLRGRGNAGAEDIAFDRVGRLSDRAVLPFYDTYHFGNYEVVMDGIRYRQYRKATVAVDGSDERVEIEVDDDRGYVFGIGFPERELNAPGGEEGLRASAQALRRSLEALGEAGRSSEKLAVLKPLLDTLAGYRIRTDKYGYKERRVFEALAGRLESIPRDGNRRRELLTEILGQLRELDEEVYTALVRHALDSLKSFLDSNGDDVSGWGQTDIRLAVNTVAPFSLELGRDGETAVLTVDLLGIFRGTYDNSLNMAWEMMRAGNLLDGILADRLREASPFVRNNPQLVKQVIQILQIMRDKVDVHNGPRTQKYLGEEHSPEWKEIARRSRGDYYRELRQDRGIQTLAGLIRQLERLADIEEPGKRSLRFEANLPQRVTAILEFIYGRPQLREQAEFTGTYTPETVDEIVALFDDISRELGDTLRAAETEEIDWSRYIVQVPESDRRTTSGTSNRTDREEEEARAARERERTKEQIMVHARELLGERESTQRTYKVGDSSSAYSQGEDAASGDRDISFGSDRESTRREDRREPEQVIFVPLEVTSRQYLDRMRPAVEAMAETKDPSLRTMIFFSEVLPQLLMASAHEVATTDMLRLTRRGAGLLDSSVEKIFSRLLQRSFSPSLIGKGLRGYSANVRRNRALIEDLARDLRNNAFLKEQLVYVQLEVLERTQNFSDGSQQSVSILSSQAFRIDAIEIDTDGPRNRRGALPEIYYLGQRIDRVDEDIAALGFTWNGDTFGVVLKDIIDGETYSDVLPHLFERPFRTYGGRGIHRLSELIRRGVQRDYPRFPGADQIEAILRSRHASTGIHERQHTRDELNGVQNRYYGAGRRIAQETTAYLSSIAFGDAPYTDLVKVIELHISLNSGLAALFAGQNAVIYGQATGNILNLFAQRLGVDEFDLNNRLLDSNADLMDAALALSAAELKAMAADILNDVIALQKRGKPYAPAFAANTGASEAAAVELAASEAGVTRAGFSDVTEATLIITLVAALLITPYIYSRHNPGGDLDVTDSDSEPLATEQAPVPPLSALPRYLDEPSILIPPDVFRDLVPLIEPLIDYSPRPDLHITGVSDVDGFITRRGAAMGTLSGIAKLYFDNYFAYPEIHSANANELDLDPLPDPADYNAVRGFYYLPQNVSLIVPGGLEVAYSVQPGDRLELIAQRFYGIQADGSPTPLAEWDGISNRPIYQRIMDRNGIRRPEDLQANTTIIIPTNQLEYGRNILGVRPDAQGAADQQGGQSTDRAVLSRPVGGIDLNAGNMELHSSGDAIQMNVPAELQELQTVPVNGFVPVIINISPVLNLPLILGGGINGDSLAGGTEQEAVPLESADQISWLAE
ncbi:MAG: LysM peptidoglycan-binding domain-containing protein [Candidatus Omnitrophica bacterium]|nr:LysM peptidoglycan-binding domain-containing protein [Candidatus Omnitrophota bacterium]